MYVFIVTNHVAIEPLNQGLCYDFSLCDTSLSHTHVGLAFSEKVVLVPNSLALFFGVVHVPTDRVD